MNKSAIQPFASVKCRKTRQRRDNPPQTKTRQPSAPVKNEKTIQPQKVPSDTDTKNVSKPSPSKDDRSKAQGYTYGPTKREGGFDLQVLIEIKELRFAGAPDIF